MVGRAGPTIVWSSAPRNSPSITAKRISIFSRWLRPSAGSSSSEGMYSSAAAGNASMRLSVPPLDMQMARSFVDRGRRERRSQVGHRRGDAGQLRRVELVEDAHEDLRSEHLHVVQQLPPV